MYTMRINEQKFVVLDVMNTFTTLPIEVRFDHELTALVSDLTPETPWGDRKKAAERIGNNRRREALPALMAALPGDPFWMVRCAIIQAMEKIGDPGAVPTLEKVAKEDRYQVVRSYAQKAVERLSS